VGLSVELSIEFTLLLPFGQLGSHHFSQKLFSFDQRNLNITVWVTIQRQLTSHPFRKGSINDRIFFADHLDDVITLFRVFDQVKFFLMVGQKIIQFMNQFFYGRNKFNNPFRNQYSSKIITLLGTLDHRLGYVGHQIIE